MIVIKNKFIPFKGYETINLFGILFTHDDYIDPIEYNHEDIHSTQWIECTILAVCIIMFLCIFFNISFWLFTVAPVMYYIQYCLEYIIIRCFHKKQGDAYHDVSFEEEAYNNEHNMNYVKTRSPFAWIKYVKLKSN